MRRVRALQEVMLAFGVETHRPPSQWSHRGEIMLGSKLWRKLKNAYWLLNGRCPFCKVKLKLNRLTYNNDRRLFCRNDKGVLVPHTILESIFLRDPGYMKRQAWIEKREDKLNGRF